MGSVRLDPIIQEKVRRVAQMKGLSLSQVHRLALERFCEQEIGETRVSRYSDVIGVGEGEADLSSRAKAIFQEILDSKHGG